MVSLRCKMMVQEEIDKLGLGNAVVQLGTVDFPDVIDKKNLKFSE